MHLYWLQFQSSVKECYLAMKEKIADFDGEASNMVAIFVLVAVPVLSLLHLHAQYSLPSLVLSIFHRRRDNIVEAAKAEEEREKNGIQINCIVCLSQVNGDEKPRFLPCNHGFHLHCINGWLKTHPTCPLCRYPVADFDHDHRQRPNRFYHGWVTWVYSFLLSLENFRQWLASPLSPELMSSLFSCSGGFQ